MTEEWLSPAEVGQLCGGHTYQWVKRLPPEELPYYRFGSRGDRRYRREDVEAFIKARRVEGGGAMGHSPNDGNP